MSETTENQYRVSVALATYNGAAYLAQLLESLSRQTLPPFEVVAFDDGSSDDTRVVLTRYSQQLPLRVYVNEQSVGVVENFRRAVACCQGDYIAFCDQDDVWLPDKLARSVEALKGIDGPGPAMVFTDLVVVDEHLNQIADSYWRHRGLKPDKETFGSLIYGNIVTGCTMIINRPMSAEVARMPTDVLMHDFWIACVAYGIGRYAYVKEPTILYRQHASNVTSNDAVTWRTRWQRLRAMLTNGEQAAQFLRPEMKQGRQYADLYANHLSPTNRAALNRLFRFGRRPPLLRKWQTFLIKFLHIQVCV